MSRRAYALLLVLFISPAAWAAPTITSVSIPVASVVEGTTITITGTGFGPKSPAGPYVWADFEDGTGNPSPLGTKTAWDGVMNLATSTACGLVNSTYCAVGSWNASPLRQHFHLEVVNTSTYTTIYTWGRRKFTAPLTVNQKMWRLWVNAGASGNSSDFLGMLTQSNGMCYNEFNTVQPDRFQGFATSYTSNTWHVEQHIWTHGSSTGVNGANEGNGTWQAKVDGITIQTSTTMANGLIEQKDLLLFDNFTDASNMEPDGTQVFEDELYADTTTARVMVCDAATYSGSSHCEIAIPLTWSATSITAKFHQGTFGAESKYVYVFDGTIPDQGVDSTPNAAGVILMGTAKATAAGSISISGSVTIR